ncbi:hypothetical protein ABPG75_005531 [Micractinium tetrahymenae]
MRAAAATCPAASCSWRARPRFSSRRGIIVGATWTALGKHHQNRLFIFGLGYTGLGAARYFQQRGWEVAGTCRTLDKCERLAQRGIVTYHFDPTEWDNLSGKALESLRHATHVLSTVPPHPESDADPVIMAHAQQLSERADGFRWVGYISSTSVYGDYEGEWVDEGSELRAAGGKGFARVMAEHEWLALHDNFGLPVHIFRCGGIYGPGRSAIEAVQRSLAGGEARPSAARRARQRYTARCHVFDICQSLEASMRHSHPGAAYNVADDDPADRGTVMAYAQELLHRKAAWLPPPGPGWGVPTPPPAAAAAVADGAAAAGAGSAAAGAESAAAAAEGRESVEDLVTPISSINTGSSGSYDSADELLGAAGRRPSGGAPRIRPRLRSSSSGGSSSGALEAVRLEEKRVRNGRIKQELGVQLAFPSYREGLAAIAAGDRRPFDEP